MTSTLGKRHPAARVLRSDESKKRIHGEEETPLYIGGYFALDGRFASWSKGMYPAVLLALEHINTNPSVLPGYRLEVIANNTSSDAGFAIRSFIHQLGTPSTKLMIISALSSTEDMALAETSKWWNLIQVGSVATYPNLSDKLRFPLYYRTRMTGTSKRPALIRLLRHFGWNRVAVIHQDLNQFNSLAQELSQEIVDSNMTLVTLETYSFNDPMTDIVKRLKELDVRIILMIGYQQGEFYCECLRNNFFGPRYVIIWSTLSTKTMFAGVEGKCTPEEVIPITEGALTIEQEIIRGDDLITVSGLTGNEFLEHYENLTASLGYPTSIYSALAYDSMWTIALALNKSMQILPGNRHLEDFSYEDSEIADVIARAMNDLEFEGISGPVIYTDTGDRRGRVAIKQIEADKLVSKKGYYDTKLDQYTWTTGLYWKGGKVPRDETIYEIVSINLNRALFYGICILITCCITMALYYLTFNIIHRNQRHIKLSSPNMNNLTVAGGILVYISAIFCGLDSLVTSEYKSGICMVRSWLLSIGFTVGFGALFSKTWRVHKIFTHKSRKSLRIRDWHLFGVILLLLLVDIVILTSWTVIDPFVLHVHLYPKQPQENGEDLVIIPKLEECKSRYETVWLGVLFGYKGIILLFGVFLAWETRKVKYSLLNDSRYIGSAVYNVTVFSSIGVPSTMFLSPTQRDLHFILSTFCIVFCTTVSLCIVFVPKLYDVRDEHRNVTDSALGNTNTIATTSRSTALSGNGVHCFKHRNGTCEKAEAELEVLRRRCNLPSVSIHFH
ncbi:gamma-aminobutyric acid type B receptor subunit 2-like [Glandiceps talaboti]